MLTTSASRLRIVDIRTNHAKAAARKLPRGLTGISPAATAATANYSPRESNASHPTICLILGMIPQTRCLILPHTEEIMRLWRATSSARRRLWQILGFPLFKTTPSARPVPSARPHPWTDVRYPHPPIGRTPASSAQTDARVPGPTCATRARRESLPSL